MRKVEVLMYNEDWSRRFKDESYVLKTVFGDLLTEIHHIGSTSVPGLAAKPVIDIIPVVTNIEDVDGFNEQMKRLGYEPRGEYGLKGRRYFPKGGNERTFHVHMYEKGNPEIERHIVFRDYLRAHEKEANAYSELKRALAKQFPYDIESYINGKDAFVKQLDEKASEWHKQRHAK